MDKQIEFEKEHSRLQSESIPKEKSYEYFLDALFIQTALGSIPEENRAENLSFDDLEKRLSGLEYGIMDNSVTVPLEFGLRKRMEDEKESIQSSGGIGRRLSG